MLILQRLSAYRILLTIHIYKMKYNFDTEKKYLAPMCKVYSITSESVIAQSNSACDSYDPENDLGEI